MFLTNCCGFHTPKVGLDLLILNSGPKLGRISDFDYIFVLKLMNIDVYDIVTEVVTECSGRERSEDFQTFGCDKISVQ